jgi:4-amino-4-deoxy-L-arabinose transferase-like glycosyltransferase
MSRARFLIPLSLAQFSLLVFRSGRQSLWLDEVMSLDAARSPWPRLLAFFRFMPEQHPLYYLVLRTWLPLGTSEVMLRFPSAIFAVATLWVFYLLAERLFDGGVARIAAVLLTLSPFYLYYGQEARMYTMMGFLAVLASLLMVIWLERGSARTLTAYLAIAVLGVYTHLFFFFLLLAHWAFILVHGTGWVRRARILTGGYALVGLAYLPWAYLILARGGAGQSWKGLQHIIFGIPYTLLRFSLGYSQVLANHGWKDRIGSLILENAPILSLAMICFGTAGIVGAIRSARLGVAGRFVLFCLAVPLMVAILVSFKVVLIGERYFIVSFPFYLLLLAVGVRTMLGGPGRARRLGVACVALYGLITVKCLYDYYFSPSFGKEQWADVAEYIRDHADRAEMIVVHSGFAANSLQYYYPDTTIGQLRRSDEVTPDTLAGLPRYWLVIAHSTDEAEYRRGLARTHNTVSEEFFPLETGIRVLLLEHRSNPLGSGAASNAEMAAGPAGQIEAPSVQPPLPAL